MSTSRCPSTTPRRSDDNLLSQIKRTLSPSQQYLLNFESTPSDTCLQSIKTAIIEGNALLVSDGSFFPETQESAFHTILETGDRQHAIRLSQRVPGCQQDFDSFRAEAAGITAGKILILALCKYLNILQGGIVQCCDGQSALKKCSATWKIRAHEPHHDILQLALETATQLPPALSIHHRWIKGHLDMSTPFNQLPRPNQLNILCDTSAKIFAKSDAPSASTQVSTQHWSLHWNGIRQVNHIQARFRNHIESPALINYWTNKEIVNLMGRPTHQSAILEARKLSPPALPLGITKLISNNAPTHGTLHKWRFRDNGQCPFCGHENETTLHMLTCNYHKGNDRWH